MPKGFRRTGATPEGLTLHFGDLPESDIVTRKGYRLTTPLRTSGPGGGRYDAWEELSKALLGILERDLITREQAEGARIPEAAQLQLEALLGWTKR